jgi:hypothetical protein
MEKQMKVEAKNVSMYDTQWDIVDRYARSMGLSTSAALRVIVNQWRELRQQYGGLRVNVVPQEPVTIGEEG